MLTDCKNTLLEADFNLLLKWFGSHGILKHAKQYYQLTNNQGGNKKGHSAIHLACKKACTFELIHNMCYIAANLNLVLLLALT